jgi:ketol-acid reductoisomerase
MNTLKMIRLVFLYTLFMSACTTDNTVEEHLTSNKINIIGTGSDGTAQDDTVIKS